MPSNSRSIALLSAVLAVGAPLEAGTDEHWFAAGNDTTVAISQESSGAARLAAALAIARSVMQRVAAVDSPLPVRAFAEKNEASLRELVPQYWEGRGVRPHGASYAGPYTAFIAVRANIAARQHFPLVLHEYAHLLTAAHVPDAPTWLDEGLSEFWSGLVLDGQQVVIGRPSAQYVRLLRTRTWLTSNQMQQHERGKLSSDQNKVSMFYAQSWARVHFLMLGRDPSAPLTYAPGDHQWTPQLEADLRVYLTEGRFREVALPLTGVDTLPLTAEPISEAHALAERASMVVFGQRPDAAQALATRALALDPRQPLALEVMGTYHFLRNQPEQARDWLSRALDVNSQSYSAALYLALLSQSAADQERYLVSAVKAKPDLGVAWRRLWALYSEDGRAERAIRWCERLTELARPWWWIDEPLDCGGRSKP